MERVRLGSICRPKQWKTLTGKELVSDGKYPVYGANGIIGYYNEYNHEKETLLIGCRGTCGALNICKNHSYVNGNAMALDNLDEDINVKYLYYALMGRGLKDVISGAVQPQIIRSDLEKIEVLVGTKEEQEIIIDIFDRLDTLIVHRQQELRLLDDLTKARFVEFFGDTVINPLGWAEQRLDEYITFLTSGSRGWAQYFTDEGSELFITIKNVKNNHITLDDIQYVDAPENKEAERTKVKTGDLLISITADLGRTGVVDDNIADRGAYINQHLSLVRLDTDRINPLYVSYFLETSGGKRQFESKNQNGVKAGLNFEAIKSLKILVPPIVLQEHYLDYVKQIDKSKVAVQKSLEETQLLFDSLMQKYFG